MRWFTVVFVLVFGGVGQAEAGYVALLDTFEEVLTAETDRGGVWSPFVVYDPDVPGADQYGPYRMWYGGANPHIFVNMYSDSWIGHAWSWDGVNFTNQQIVHTADPRGDEIPGYHWTRHPVVTKTDSGYRLYHERYYFRGPIPPWAGCVEISIDSQDGLSFDDHIEHAMDPLWMDGGWDFDEIAPGTILLEDNQYVLYYTALGDHPEFEGRGTIGRAVSSDGVNWSQEEGDDRRLVLPPGQLGEWDWTVIMPSVFRLRDGDDGYGMFFRGSPNRNWDEYSIGFSSSDDGITWSDRSPLFHEDDLPTVTGLPIEHVDTPRYFLDPESGNEYLYFTYNLEDGPMNIGRVQIVPEPATMLMLCAGAVCGIAYACRKARFRGRVFRRCRFR